MNQDNRRPPDEKTPPNSDAKTPTNPGCPLCECEEIGTGDVNALLVEEYWPEDGHPDHLGLKRTLEAGYGVSLVVSQVRRHIDEHVVWSWSHGGDA